MKIIIHKNAIKFEQPKFIPLSPQVCQVSSQNISHGWAPLIKVAAALRWKLIASPIFKAICQSFQQFMLDLPIIVDEYDTNFIIYYILKELLKQAHVYVVYSHVCCLPTCPYQDSTSTHIQIDFYLFPFLINSAERV